MSDRWNYGDAYIRHPIPDGHRVVFDDGSMLQVHDIFNPIPAFLKEADCMFVDPPWNLGNLNTFYTKAGLKEKHKRSFERFYKRLFECIQEIAPATCYIEVGKEYLAEFIIEMKKLFPRVTFYNSMYYRRKDRLCYVIRGAQKTRKLDLDGLDEEDIIKWVCEHEDYEVIVDPCMGTGLVGKYARLNNHKFHGTELNDKRLSVLVETIVKMGGNYKLEPV